MHQLRSGLLYLTIAAAFLTSALAAANRKEEEWRTYAFRFPGGHLEFSVPSTLASGYRPVPREIVFGDPSVGFRLGQAATEIPVAIFFGGAKRNLSDYDWDVHIGVVEFDAASPMPSTAALFAYTEPLFHERATRMDGSQFVSFGDISVRAIGSHEVIVAQPAELTRVEDVQLKNGFHMMIQPRQNYVIRLDDRHCLMVRVLHFTAKRLSPEWHARTTALVEEMIARMKITPDAQVR